MKVYYPPKRPPLSDLTVFLAGTIDQGNSRDWQSDIIKELSVVPVSYGDVSFVNPRRPDWDSNWHDNHPELIKQIRWELSELQHASLILMWIEPHSKSPITLLEMGLFANRDNLVIGCPDEFYRSTNVRETAKFMRREHHSVVKFTNTWEKFVITAKREFKNRYVY